MTALEIAVKALEYIYASPRSSMLAAKTACDALAAIAAKQVDVTPDANMQAMNEIAQEYAHSLALELECILYEYSGQWYDRAIATLNKYREAMNAIRESESPTYMGEPFLPKDQPSWIRNAKAPIAQDIGREPTAPPCMYCGSTSVCDQSIPHPAKHGKTML